MGNGTAGKFIIALILLACMFSFGLGLFILLFQDEDGDFKLGGTCSLTSASPQVQKLVGAENQSDKKLQELLPKYKKAADKYHIPWEYLAAIHKTETNNGRTPTTDEERRAQTSSVGAVGPGQFMWRTWVGWSYQVVKDFPGSNQTRFFNLGDLHLTPEQEKEITKVKNISKYGGAGVDADGDGYANPWDEDDAIEATAKKLAQDGGANGDINKAILSYNHSEEYLRTVTNYSRQFANGATFACSGQQLADGSAPENVKRMIERALAEKDNIDYFMGNPQQPPENGKRGKLDCSGFVQWLYREYLGIDLPRTTEVQQASNLGHEIDKSQLRAGDLVFFQNTYKNGVSHVGLYMGDGKFIHAAGTGKGVKISDLSENYWIQHWHSAVRYIK